MISVQDGTRHQWRVFGRQVGAEEISVRLTCLLIVIHFVTLCYPGKDETTGNERPQEEARLRLTSKESTRGKDCWRWRCGKVAVEVGGGPRSEALGGEQRISVISRSGESGRVG